MKSKRTTPPTRSRIADRGFTLVELLIVVGIIALLVALIVPGMGQAKHLSRRTVCAHNLRQIGEAFLARAARTDRPSGENLYPRPRAWPIVPYDVLEKQEVFLCPEDPGRRWEGVEVPGLQWRVADYRRFVVDFREGVNCKTRKGSDARGNYVEYVFEENYSSEAFFSGDGSDYPNCSERTDKDGVFRVYDNEDGSVTVVLVNLTVLREPPDELLVGGEVRWQCTRAKLNQPDRVILPNGGFTSYGINSLASAKLVKPNTAILVDYLERAVDISKPHDSAKLLVQSARHLGRMNTLFADQSVRTMGPTELDPRVNLNLWSP